ncbi:DUF4340 domain-containing protein [Candidatus Peregrinibacteria bacterium]|nr:DUF4340 domain-containing protein [Candidatus Peregrinibacteria bacterium]
MPLSTPFRESFRLIQKAGPLKVATILFAALAIFILVFEQPGNPQEKALRGQKYFIPLFNLETVSGLDLILSGEGPTVSLEKREGEWVIQNGGTLPADPEAVAQLLEVLNDLKEGLIVSKNPEKHALYGVDPQKGVEVRVFAGEREIADFFTGSSEKLGKEYLRRNGSDIVIEAVPSLRNLILDPAEWENG